MTGQSAGAGASLAGATLYTILDRQEISPNLTIYTVVERTLNMDKVFTIPFHVQGTLAANHTMAFKLPFDAQLVAVSVNNTTAYAGKIDVGIGSDDDAYLDNKAFGTSGTPLVYDRDDFVDTQFPHIAAGTIILATITDHVSHMAAATALLIFTKG